MDRRSLLTVATGTVGAVAAAGIPASAAHPAPAGRGRPLATFDVISDIQGDLRVLGVALEDMHRTHPGARDFASGTWLKQITVPLSTRI
ncbi:hypothetical protein [Streptomyces sp. NPDC096351]|uniref:hypothetical protein n=1 Tax=Streptomyces sp. NPDC096351 TaxID=3366087 RepID=UPI0037FB1EE1